MKKPGRFVTGLMTPIQYLKGIGPKRAEQFARLGVETVGQLLFLVPRRYIDRSSVVMIRELKVGDEATVVGRVMAVNARRTRNHRAFVSCLVRDSSGTIEVVWFNRPDLAERFNPGQEILVSGQVTEYRRRQFVNPLFELAEAGNEFSFANAIIPVYPLTEGLNVWAVRRAVRVALDRFGGLVSESLPREVLTRYNYPGIQEALRNIHFPNDVGLAQRSRERLIYDELFYLELLLALRRRAATQSVGQSLVEKGNLTRPFLERLPFQLTGAQTRVLAEIRQDMARPVGMNRLLQGDVGSGKTVLALAAMLIACENGFQAAMMAPTEILAEQHFLGWQPRLAELGVETVLLTGSVGAAEKRRLLAGLEDGTVKVVFGTHALIEQGVKFCRLGLVVVDEQHRFGVMQRAALLNKGLNPDFLVMTATPIPRTLTMTVYGDLDVSILDEKPPGRRPVQTRLVTDRERPAIYRSVARHLDAGEQAFVVCPVIEESEKLDLASAIKTYEEMKVAFPRHRVGLVHGRLSSDERLQMMARFRRRDLDMLVATSVIEVGVDVPNATMMLIEHPERFGLAQLHQLRGRIGRSRQQSYCILLAGNAVFGDVLERLRFFAATTDGFALAEKDLELRGPGEILGTRQHGLPDLKVADIVRDRAVLARARQDAFRLIALDPELAQPQNECIRQTLLSRYAGRAELARVG
ncbi:MAG: ATP-dependent DNA helicase RecG [candidate division WOR-3 bacterium]